MPLNNSTKRSSGAGMPPLPTSKAKIAAFVIMAVVLACPFLWSLGSGPLLRTVSPLVCPNGSELTIHSQHVQYLSNGNKRKATDFNLNCVDPSGNSVPNHAEIILFSVCAVPFVGLTLMGVIGALFRKNKK